MKRGILIGMAGTMAAIMSALGAIIWWVKDDLDGPHNNGYPNAS